MNRINCRLNTPYPTPKADSKNVQLGKKLLLFYAGRYSEFTACTQYTYQQIILKNDYPYIADVLECISIVEMKHFELLGELILSLGANPFIGDYERNRQYFWSGKYISYTPNPKTILSDNLKAEKRAIEDYKSVIQKSNDTGVKRTLERIILDEEHHVKILNAVLAELS